MSNWQYCTSCGWLDLGDHYTVIQELPRGRSLVIDKTPGKPQVAHKILTGRVLKRQTLKTPPPAELK